MDKALAKAKFDRGTKMIKAGLDLMDEYMEMVKNERKKPDSGRETLHESSSDAGVHRVP